MPHEDLENSREHDTLLARERPSHETRHSYSSFRDVGAADLSASVESLPSVNDDASTIISKWRATAIILSLGVLVLIQGIMQIPLWRLHFQKICIIHLTLTN
jgi:hypothetical protein